MDNSNKITVTVVGRSFQAPRWSTALDILDEITGEGGVPKGDILAVTVNNNIVALTKQIGVNCTIAPVVAGSAHGSSVYRRSVCFVLCAAVHAAFPGSRLVIGHSLGYSYYYTLEKKDDCKKLMQGDLAVIEGKMREIIAADYPIDVTAISYADACALFDKLGLRSARERLRYSCPPEISVNRLGPASEEFAEPSYGGPLVHRTGILDKFSLSLYDEGFLLHYPSTQESGKVAPFTDIPQLFAVYKHYKNWGRKLAVSTAAAINQMVHDRTVNNFIDITELLQQKQIAAVADSIAARKDVKVVLLAGPSSSGKTTSSKKLSLQLKVIGYTPKVIELDSYYVDRRHTPRDETGKFDYECLEALDVAQLGADLDNLFNGKEIDVPSYDFTKGERFYTNKKLCLGEGDILLLEGIHGLNDKLTPSVPHSAKFKLYLSAVTQLNLDDHNRVPTSDNRLIRRIVRDSRFRGKSAAQTIGMWDSVQRGERLHIFPFQNDADAVLNTALDYELSVLKVFADPLLRCVSPLENEYTEASRLLSFLDNFLPISPDYVPGQSIIREFIGNSDFSY